MPWFYVDDDMAFNRKIVFAGNPAIGLWTRAGAWSRKEGTHGFIPTDMVRSLGTPQQASRLVTVPPDCETGLWLKANGGYQFHQWHDRYDPEKESEVRRKRSAAGRIGGIKSGVTRKSGSKNEANASAESKQMLQQTLEQTLEQTPQQKRTHVLVLGSGYLEGESLEPNARKNDTPPQNRCSNHINDPDPPPCRACGDARKAHDEYVRDQAKHAAMQRSNDARTAAELRAAAIANCPLCDDTGYRGTALCDHDPDADERRKRGIAQARAALTKGPTNA